MLFVLGVTDFFESGTGSRLGRLGQGVHAVRHLVDPTPLVDGLGEDVGQGSPKAEGAIADGQNWGGHAPALQSPQDVGPGLGRLPVSVGDRDQLFGPV